MPTKVKLDDIVEALDMQLDEFSSFLDLDTGQVETIPDDLLSEARESDDDDGEGEHELADWEQEQLETAKRIVTTDRFVSLPTKFDVHEWEIMQDFARSVESTKISDELQRAIHGKGAFRMFKDTLQRHNIESAWFDFRAGALKQIAIEWCEENQIVWE
jgi:hypothetical protein